MLTRIFVIRYLARSMSDRSPLIGDIISNKSMTSSLYWKLNPYWLHFWLDLERIKQQISEFFTLNVGTASRLIICDAMKVYLRGILKAEVVRKRLEFRRQEEESKKKVLDREKYVEEPSGINKEAW